MSKQVYDPNELEGLYDESIDTSRRIQKDHIEAAQHAGYIGDVLEHTRDMYIIARNSVSSNYKNIAISATNFVGTIHGELAEIEIDIKNNLSNLEYAAAAIDTQSATSSAIADIDPIVFENPIDYEPNPVQQKRDRAYYIDKLIKLDKSLGDTYKQIWEVCSTTTEPERSALYQIRQTFDHFFQILSPDDEVRNSEFWIKKNGNKPYRRERLLFAANKHIKDTNKREYIVSNTELTLETYRLLNQAHKRGKLNRDSAKKTLYAMDKIIHDWIDAIEI